MPIFSSQKLQALDSKSFVTVDLDLAGSSLTRPMLVEDIRQAIFNDGFFVIENFKDSGLVDAASVARLSSLIAPYFGLSKSVKNSIDIANSSNFRGHFTYASPSNRQDSCDMDEEALFGTDTPSPTQFDDEVDDMSATQTLGGTPVYQWLRGPNQWPRPRALPGFKKDVENFIESMAEFSSNFVSEFITEAIGGDASLFESAFDQPQNQHQLRLVKKAARGSEKVQNSDPFTFKDKLAFASYLFRPENDTSRLQIVGSDGRITYLEPNPGSFVVVFGEAMEHLTRGLCKSASYSLESSLSTAHVAAFTQCMSVDFSHKNYVFPRALLAKTAKTNDCEIYCDDEEVKETPFQFFDDYGMSSFSRYMHQFPTTAQKWYSHLSSKNSLVGSLPRKLSLLIRLHKSIDNSILLHTISSSASINFTMLGIRVSEDSRLTLEMAYLQQILTIWPESYTLTHSVVNQSELTVSVPPSLDRKVTLIKSLPIRQAVFKAKCFEYAKLHDCSEIPLSPITLRSEITTRRVISPRSQSSRMTSMRKSSREQTSPYSLTRKLAPLTGSSQSRLNKSGGPLPPSAKKIGSVLDRIRAKEAAAKEAQKFAETPESLHRRYIESKLPSIAAIVAGLRKPSREGSGQTLALHHVMSKIMDSVVTTLSPSEAEGALRMLAEKLPEFCTLTTVGKVTGVRIENEMSVTTIRQRLITAFS